MTEKDLEQLFDKDPEYYAGILGFNLPPTKRKLTHISPKKKQRRK